MKALVQKIFLSPLSATVNAHHGPEDAVPIIDFWSGWERNATGTFKWISRKPS